MPIFVSFARYIFLIFIPRLKLATHSICVKLLHKHDKLTQCCHAFTLALARLLVYSSISHPKKEDTKLMALTPSRTILKILSLADSPVKMQ